MLKGQRGAHLLEFFRNLTPQALFFGCAVYFWMLRGPPQIAWSWSNLIAAGACLVLWLLSVIENGFRFLRAYLKENQRAAAVWALLEDAKRPAAEVFLRLLKDAWKHNKGWLVELVFALVIVWASLIPMTMFAYQSAASLYKLSIESAAAAQGRGAVRPQR